MAYTPRRVPQLVAHKGDASANPENSLAAFAAAARLDVDMIEMDVWASVDGRPVVVHGPRLDSVTDGRGRVSKHPSEVLHELRLRDRHGGVSVERIPSLDDALDAIGPSHAVNCDVKHLAVLDAVAATLVRRGMTDRAVVSGLTARGVRRVRRRHPEVTALLNLTRLDKVIARSPRLRSRWVSLRYRRMLRRSALALNIHHGWVDRPLIDAVHALDAQVWVFTVDDQPTIDRLVAMGVDSITTNEPGGVRLPRR